MLSECTRQCLSQFESLIEPHLRKEYTGRQAHYVSGRSRLPCKTLEVETTDRTRSTACKVQWEKCCYPSFALCFSILVIMRGNMQNIYSMYFQNECKSKNVAVWQVKNKCPPVVQCLEDLKQWHLTVVVVNTGHKTKTFTLPDTSTNTLIKACLTSFLRYNLQFVHHKNNMETLDSYILRPYILRSYISSCCCCLFWEASCYSCATLMTGKWMLHWNQVW